MGRLKTRNLLDIARPSKLLGLTSRDWTTRDLTTRHQIKHTCRCTFFMLHGILYERHLSHLSLCNSLLRDLWEYFTIYYYYKNQFTLISSKQCKQDATLSQGQPRDAPYIWVPWKLYVSAKSADDCARIATLQSYHHSVVKSFSKCSHPMWSG